MSNLLSFNAHKCQAAIGIMLHAGKTLLVKHKKLGVWMAPGGHLDEGELPHQAAEREFLEETGVVVRAIDPFMETWESVSQYFPSPILTNLHWIVRENYDARIASANSEELHTTELWPLGCEQHVGFIFIVEAASDNVVINPGPGESPDVRWFTPDEVRALGADEIYPDSREELLHVFGLAQLA